MFDIHAVAESARAKGLQQIELPLNALIIAALGKKHEEYSLGVCGRQGFPKTIAFFFKNLKSDRIILGILDPSTKNILVPWNDKEEKLELSRDHEISEELADDIWIVLRSRFEHRVLQEPSFHQICFDFMLAEARRTIASSDRTENRLIDSNGDFTLSWNTTDNELVQIATEMLEDPLCLDLARQMSLYDPFGAVLNGLKEDRKQLRLNYKNMWKHSKVIPLDIAERGGNEMNKKAGRSRTRKSGSLPDVKGMVAMLRSLYSPAQLREIVNGLNLPAEEHTWSSTSHNNEKE